jgi:carbonic anhydrase
MCRRCDLAPLTRRALFSIGLAATAVAVMPRPTWAQSAPPSVSPDGAIRRLQEGNARYAANTSTNKDFSAGRMARASAQYPFASIVSCADSRVSPELAFDQGPGDLFVVRVAGNFVNEDGLASLEYGAVVLGSRQPESSRWLGPYTTLTAAWSPRSRRERSRRAGWKHG